MENVTQKIVEAHERIRSFIHKTPLLTNQYVDQITNCNVLFKCENFQKGGAFKARGAHNAVLQLPSTDKKMGICTHSSGNHAQALALAAKNTHTTAYIVMPENAPVNKISAVKEYGGHITFCKPTLAAREESLEQIQKKTGATFIHPYNNMEVIYGQATATKEIADQNLKPDYIIAPVGGGGLLSGTLLSASAFLKNTKVIAAEPKEADDAYRSFYENKIIPSINPKTIADGLKTSLGSLTFPIIRKYCHDIVTVEESEIIEAMRLIWQRLKIIVEPSSVLPLAVVLKRPKLFQQKKVVLILSGGNADIDNLPFSTSR